MQSSQGKEKEKARRGLYMYRGIGRNSERYYPEEVVRRMIPRRHAEVSSEPGKAFTRIVRGWRSRSESSVLWRQQGDSAKEAIQAI